MFLQKSVPLRQLTLGIVLLILFGGAAAINYLFFHTMIELFTIIILVIITILTVKTYQYSHNNLLLSLGTSFFFIAIIDLFHLMTYKGIHIISGNNPNIPTQFWIAGRYLIAITYLIAPLYRKRRFNLKAAVYIYASLTALIIASILWLPVFPVCYVEGKGLTPFKIVSEYLIIILFALTGYVMHRLKRQMNRSYFDTALCVLSLNILTEFCFTLYINVYDAVNFGGHIFRVCSDLVIANFAMKEGVDHPYELIFSRLHSISMKDALTGLLNRLAYNEFIERVSSAPDKSQKYLIWLFDLDNFKMINDRFGHLVGDQVLIGFARLMSSIIRQPDMLFRLGGDEFILITAFHEQTAAMESRITEAVRDWITANGYPKEFGLSIGVAIWDLSQEKTIDSVIKTADANMYRQKAAKSTHVVR